jgi:CubicO group peptidase (beta-lactamase class C family)
VRRTLLALTAAVSLLLGANLHADDFLFGRFGDYLDALRAQAGIPGLAAAIVGTNDILWHRAFGRQDLEQLVATRTDTPFEIDGLTQMLAATIVLRCVEDGSLWLDEPIAQFDPGSPYANATIRQILTHTSDTPAGLVFAYRPERLAPLASAIKACGASFRGTLSILLDRLGMVDSVPGLDAVHLVPPADDIPSASAVDRYTRTLQRLATPYAVDSRGHASPSQYTAATLTPAGGLISTVDNLAQFDLALKGSLSQPSGSGVLLRADTLAGAWRPPAGASGQQLPHGFGWFVQTYNGEPVVWQFGVSENASSSLMVTLPARGLTLILLANSSGLVKTSELAAGDLTVSPFGRLFLRLFALGS